MKYFLLLILLIPMLGANQTQTAKNQPQWDESDDHNFINMGVVTQQQILTLEVFQYRYNAYEPDKNALEQIGNAPPAEIKVFFGDWCKDSKKHVPAFIKTMELASNPGLQIAYINVDRQKKQPSDLIESLNIENVPTFIVFENGKEVGRIVETPKTSVEQDLADILAAVPAN
jgi:thiol-disulfide isomerase/thioredoxin